jgi:hypothetical protein
MIWKNISINEFSKYYQISTNGDIKNTSSNKIISQHMRNGYKAVCLYNPETKKKKTYNVHSIVAYTYLINEDNNNLCINHIDGVKTNNNFKNLEWTTYKKNSIHAVDNGLINTFKRSVYQITLDDKIINTFSSIKEAAEKTKANDRHISAVCKGKRKTTGGYKWKYVIEDEIIEEIDGKEIKDFPNYLITKDGKIYSKKTKKYLKPNIHSNGLETVKLCNNGKQDDVYIHKIFREYY